MPPAISGRTRSFRDRARLSDQFARTLPRPLTCLVVPSAPGLATLRHEIARQVFELNRPWGGLGRDHVPADVHQLTEIAGPGSDQEQLGDLGRECWWVLAALIARGRGKEFFRNVQNVGSAIGQARHTDPEVSKSIQQVGWSTRRPQLPSATSVWPC